MNSNCGAARPARFLLRPAQVRSGEPVPAECGAAHSLLDSDTLVDLTSSARKPADK